MHPIEAPPVGIWLISGLNFVPDEDGILVMLPDGRSVQFPTSNTPPQKHPVCRGWYSCPDAQSIRFSLRPEGEGWLRFIEITSEGWTMVAEGEKGRIEYPCKAAVPEDLPPWYPEMLERNLKKMTAMEGKNELAEQAAP